MKTSLDLRSYKKWELLVLALASALFLLSSFLYASGIPLRKYLFGWDDGLGTEKVGVLSTAAGPVRRQLGTDNEFKGLDPSGDLFNYDTLVTSDSGGATLQLNDGGLIELGPNTMVRLTFESRLKLGGISRAASVNVVVGQATGAAKMIPIQLKSRRQKVNVSSNGRETLNVAAVVKAPPVKVAPPPPPPVIPKPVPSPSPSPSPKPAVKVVPVTPKTKIALVEPKPNEILVVPPKSLVPERRFTLSWTVAPSDMTLMVVLTKVGDPKVGEVLKKKAKTNKGVASVQVTLRQPGTYEWELKNEDGSPITGMNLKSKFSLSSEFEAIETLSPLVGGQPMESNAYTGENVGDFDITFRWKPYRGIKKYLLELFESGDGKQKILEKELESTDYTFNKSKVVSGRVFYRVTAPVGSGWTVSTSIKQFIFSFLPPLLVIPADNSEIARLDAAGNNNSILMTWQKTNFTDGYEVQIATDKAFKNQVVSRRIKENFFVMKMLPPGKYLWRVRSYSSDTSSRFSPPFTMIITP